MNKEGGGGLRALWKVRIKSQEALVIAAGPQIKKNIMEKNPWYKNVQGPFLQWQGPVGIKEDGGGCTRGQGKVGGMAIHRAAFNRNKEGNKYVISRFIKSIGFLQQMLTSVNAAF